ncbi:MAG: PAS domain-containing protein [Phycisphaera sp.]|nr:PAS domain-containing protein [Phycisphaera sp.]
MQETPEVSSKALTSRSNWEPKVLIASIGLLAIAAVIGNVFYLIPEIGDILEKSFNYRYLSDSTTYSVCEALVAALVVFTAMLAFEQIRAGLPGAGPIIGLTLVWAGATDLSHMVLTDQLLSGMPRSGIPHQLIDVSSWVWVVCRTFSVMILMFGVVVVLKRKHAIATRADMVLIFITSPLLFAVSYYLAWYGATHWIPEALLEGEPILRPWDLVPMMLWVCTAVFVLPVFYLRRRTNFTLALWLSAVPQIGAHAYLAFMSNNVFDVHFYVAQFLRVIGYFTVFVGMLLDHSRVYIELREANEDMLKAVLERDKAETTMAETEILYVGLVESLPLAVFHKDLEGRFTFVNDRLCHLVGEEEVQLIGKSDADFFPEELAQKYRSDDLAVVETGETFEDVERFISHDGREMWVHVMKNPLYNPEGRAIGIRGIFWDITDKVKAEKLAADERRLRGAAEDAQANMVAMYYGLIEALPLGVFCKDTKGRFTYVNDRMASMVDRPAAELIGKTDHDVFPKDLADRYVSVARKVIELGETHDMIEPYRSGDEASGFVHYVIAPQMDGEGHVTGVRGFFWDVTEMMEVRLTNGGTGDVQQALMDERTKREQAEASNRDFEALYSSLVETLPLAVFRKDTQGRYTFANKRWCRSKNVTLGEVIGKTDFEFHPKERADKYRQDDMRVVETREALDDIEENTDAAGNMIHVHVLKSPLYNAEGEVIGVQGMWWDVTSQVKAEEAAHAIESLYMALLESLPMAIFRKDADGRYTFANKRWCDAKGLTPQQVIGKTDYDFHPADRADKFRADDHRVMASHEPFEDTEENTDASGHTIRVHVLKSPVLDRKGNVTGVQGMWWKVDDTGHVEEPDPSDSDTA